MQELEVLEKLSEGATADVFWAQARGSNERVVMEILRPELTRDSEALQRFLTEADFRRSLNHPNLARRVGRGQLASGSPYVVSEPVLGQSLRQSLAHHGPLTPLDLVRLVRPLCAAVAYLHQAGLTHGNLAPEYVFLEDGLRAFRPKLLDSGLAFLRVGSKLSLPLRRHLVRSQYLSPERIQGQRATPASDIYALGILLFECLTGQAPFTHANPDEVRRLHLRAMPPPLPANAKLMSGIIHRCLAKDPADRFANVMELKESFARPPSGAIRARPAQPVTPTPASMTPPGGRPDPDVVGTYQLLRPLGKGGMGRVFAARHTKLGRLVAIKLLHPELARDHAFVERLVREAQAANRINHEHIVEIYDFVEEPDSPTGPRYFCVMELLTGLSLEALLRQQALPLGRAVRILRQVCSALEAAHEVGVVHRDVKPDNIFLIERHGRSDFVKVLDFGVAKMFEMAEGVTQGGEIIGTPSYMAPEQLTGREPEAGTDIYALGVVLYRILSGQVPFKSKNFGEHCARVTRDPPPQLPERTPAGEAVPRQLMDLVLQCLAKRADDRPQSMAEVSARLAPFEGMLPTSDWSMTPPSLDGLQEVSATLLPDQTGQSGQSGAESGVVALSHVYEDDEEDAGWGSRVREALRPVRSASRASSGLSFRWLALSALLLTGFAYVWGRAAAPAPPPPRVELPAQVEISVTSTPSGAHVIRLDSRTDLGVTPLSFRVGRSDEELHLRFEWAGGGGVEESVRRDRNRDVHAALGEPPSTTRRSGGKRK